MSPQQALSAMQKILPADIVNQGQVLNLGKNHHLFHCGENIQSLYFVIEGELRAIRHQADGQKAIMMRATDGEFFAAASLCLDQFPCDGLAPVETTVWSISKPSFLQTMKTSPELGTLFSLAMAREIKKQCGRVERMRLQTTRDRILHYISCETPDGLTLELSTPLAAWAEELGVAPESLYRSLSTLEKEGLVRRDGRLLRVIDNRNSSDH